MEYKSFMVVGGAGFVGSHVVDSLVEHGAEKVVVLDNFFLGKMENLDWAIKNGNVKVYREDARIYTALENIIELEKPEAVFNLAIKPLPYSFIDPGSSYMCGVEIAHNLANILRKKQFNQLIHFSSSEVYGSALSLPMSENHPLNPTTPYGAGKASADLLLTSYHRLFGIPVTIIRPFNMYGSRQNLGAYAAVIPVTIKRILEGGKPVIYGDGYQTRDFTYVKDVAEASLSLLGREDLFGRIINVGFGKEISINGLVSRICAIMDYGGEIILREPARPADVRRHCADISLAKELVGYGPKTSLDEGLRLTREWYKSSMLKFNA